MASGRLSAGIALMLLGFGILAYSAFQGDLHVGLFLIVPYVYGAGILPFFGFVLLLAGGFLALSAGAQRAAAVPSWERPPPEPRGVEEGAGAAGTRTRTKHGGFVMVGPIPFVWGNDKRMLPWLVALGVGLILLMFLLPTLLR